MKCEYNVGLPATYPDCDHEANFRIIATCCSHELTGCVEHVDKFIEQLAGINGHLDHVLCGARGTAGFIAEPLTTEQ